MNYQITNGKLKVTVDSLGAELVSVEKDGTEYLWNGDAAYWPERSPLLFPFVGRFTEGKYLLDGREYEMDIHGFARKMQFETVGKGQAWIAMELRDTPETMRMYPYHFSLQVTYRLERDEIKTEYRVQNQSDRVMYFGIGGHPGFRVPLEEGLEFRDYFLEFSHVCRPDRVGHTSACFVSGENREFSLKDGRYLPLRHDMFDDDAIVLQNMARCVTLKSEKGTRSVRVSYPDMRYLGLWHAPKTEAPYLCIEPWMSLPSRQGIVEDFACKNDLIRLKPGGIFETGWNVSLT